MFRTVSGDGGLSCPPGRGSSSAGSAGQDSPWSGLLSAVSRPALALLQRPLPARPHSAPPPGERSQADWKNRLSDEEREMFRLLDNVLVAPQRCYVNSESRDKVVHDLDVRILEGHASTLLSQVWWSSEDPPQGSKTLWSSFLGGLARSSVSRTDWLQLHQNVKQRHHLVESRTAGELLLALPSLSSAAWCPMGEVAEHASPTSPDQDHGYCSLEEEFLHMRRRYLAEPPQQVEPQPTQSSSTRQEEQEEVKGVEHVEEEQVERLALVPQCQNKSIAFIMGCPCSDDEDDDDDSSSQSEGHSSDEDDDDGFDSEGSSDFSSSSGEDNPEAELLWASLCRSSDPYDPRNFTARLHTGPAPPSIPTPPPSCSSPLPPPSPSPADSWDDSTSASEADEADSLWASFSCSLDPYSPLNFQAPLRTCSGPPAGTAVQRAPSSSPSSCPGPALAKRPDGGPSKTPSLSPSTKKVRFSDQVEFFFASGDEDGPEDRRGPWEQLARDRCRFLRRCQEVELSIGPCLQPQHRRQVYLRLNATQLSQP